MASGYRNKKKSITARPPMSYIVVGIGCLICYMLPKILSPDQLLDKHSRLILAVCGLIGVAFIVYGAGTKITYNKTDKSTTVTKMFFISRIYGKGEFKANKLKTLEVRGKSPVDVKNILIKDKYGITVAKIDEYWRGFDEIRWCYFGIPPKTRKKKKK